MLRRMQIAGIEETGQSADALFADVYARLKALAARQRSRVPEGHLATTELVHELYLRMEGGSAKRFGDPAQFFAYAARAMRHILVDAARAAMQVKAGGRHVRIPLSDPAVAALGSDPGQALALDAALHALADDDPRAARVVELHYFAGLGLEHVADIVGVNARTVERDWRYARAFLAARLPD